MSRRGLRNYESNSLGFCLSSSVVLLQALVVLISSFWNGVEAKVINVTTKLNKKKGFRYHFFWEFLVFSLGRGCELFVSGYWGVGDID